MCLIMINALANDTRNYNNDQSHVSLQMIIDVYLLKQCVEEGIKITKKSTLPPDISLMKDG